ncbi:DUF2637 domain-containing protein [Streptomyces griseorubiginosus]|uniref:DUF2637 domain-containing protein n=1 Tax=Streptomyces griseorubiginosus TaxID=67304 RepID=UPI002E80B621|nr:DUF2637 domain-containing protein [Streptomyces griseorubiginosus]WUB45309.1 DUF2637 domain-containing protein [Streptomyces griseorubiginosus]WUB53826.1 DUF2637 domain-containing protein [Streptomyces griseorubiginosus]
MSRINARDSLAIGAATVTVLLTAAAFWLSYEHLHDIADGNGLDDARAWAWPATVDLFIVAGELLMLRASLGRRGMDWWAVALAAFGSLGSIALNVAGVGYGADPMEYIVAAVPPSAALVAFGALMRQLHERLAQDAEDAPASPTVRSVPSAAEVVPVGARLLPLVARPVPVVTLEREDTQDTRKTLELDAGTGEDTDDGPPPEPPLMTTNDVAQRYGVEPSTVRNWVAAGRLDVFKKDARGRNLFHPEQLNAPHVGVGV